MENELIDKDIHIYYDAKETRLVSKGFELKWLIKVYVNKKTEIPIPFLSDSKIVIGDGGESLPSFNLEFSTNPFFLGVDDVHFTFVISKKILSTYKKVNIEDSSVEILPEAAGGKWIIDEEVDGYEIVFGKVGLDINHQGDFNIYGPQLEKLAPAMLGDTGFILTLDKVHIITGGIPSEVSDAAKEKIPLGFKGLYIGNGTFYYHKEGSDTTFPPFGIQNAFIGTGGFSGSVVVGNPSKEINFTAEQLNKDFSLDSSNANAIATKEKFNKGFKFNEVYFGQIKLQGFNVAIWQLNLSFFNSVPNSFSISGALNMPLGSKNGRWLLFKAAIAGPEGDIFLEIGGLPKEPLLNLETDWYKIVIDSIAYKMDNNIHYAIINGGVQLKIEPLDLPLLKVDKLSVGSDGSIDIEGGWAEFPETVPIDFGGFKVELKELGMGTEGEGEEIRQWFGFSGGIKLLQGLKGGASVEGLKVSWYRDKSEKDIQVSLKGIEVGLEIPDTLKIHGKISFDEETGLFRGMVDMDFQSLDFEIHGELIVGKTTDEQGREFSVFYIALRAKSSVGITLGSTGLSLYGIAGLFGVNVKPNKTEEQSWYEWYKAKPAYNMIANSKWVPAYDIFALGVGVNIGTMYDGGYSLSADIMLAILIPGPVIMLEGKADLVKVVQTDELALPENNMADQASTKNKDAKAEDVEKDQVGNFYMLAVIDGNKGTFQLNIDIKIVIQELVNLGGSLEAFFDFHDESKWYIHIGVKDPESKRIHAEVLAIFSASAYFMISAHYIKFGAAVVWGFEGEYGPVRVALRTAFSFDASLIFNPFQAEAELKFLAELGIRVFCFDFGILLEALLKASAPKPFLIQGQLHVKIGLPWPLPSFEFDVELEWKEEQLPEPPKPLLKSVAFVHHKTKDFSMPLINEEPNSDWSNIPYVPSDGRPILHFSKTLANDHDLGCVFRIAKTLEKSPEAIAFEYLLENDEQNKVQLQVLDENTNNWNDVIKGFSDIKEEKTFKLNEDSYLNGIDAKEPQIQLWQYRPFDMSGKSKPQSFRKHCKPLTTQDSFIIDFEDKVVGEQFGHSFNYRDTNFSGSGLFSIEKSHGYKMLFMDLAEAPISTDQEYKIGILSLQFSRLVAQVQLYFGGNSGLKIDEENLLMSGNGKKREKFEVQGGDIDERRLYIVSSYQKFDTLTIPLVPRYSTNNMSTRFKLDKIVGIETLIEGAKDYFATAPSQSLETSTPFLEAGRKYKLTIPTITKIKNGNTISSDKNEFYFQTDYGAGISNIINDNLLPYAKEPFHQFERYIATTSPNNGAKNYYYGYSLLIQFNEAYTKTLFGGNLKLIVQDQNYKNVLEIDDGVWLEADEFELPPLIHSESITQAAAISNSGECDTVPISYAPVQAFPLENLRGNRRYFCTIQAKDLKRLSWHDVHEFEFVTSQYQSFREHLLGAQENGSSIRTMLLDKIKKPDLNIDSILKIQNEYKTSKTNYGQAKTANKLDVLANALADLKNKSRNRHELFASAYEKLNIEVEKRFESLNILKERPSRFELVLLEMQPENLLDIPKGTELLNYMLLFESPEPLEWERLTVKLKGKAIAINNSESKKLSQKDLENISRLEPNLKEFNAIPKTNFDFRLLEFPDSGTQLFTSEIAIAKRLDNEYRIKELIGAGNFTTADKAEILKTALKLPFKDIDIESELNFFWNEDKTSAFAIFEKGVFNKTDLGHLITRGKYELDFDFVGDQNPELGLLVGDNNSTIREEVNTIHEKVKLKFEI